MYMLKEEEYSTSFPMEPLPRKLLKYLKDSERKPTAYSLGRTKNLNLSEKKLYPQRISSVHSIIQPI